MRHETKKILLVGAGTRGQDDPLLRSARFEPEQVSGLAEAEAALASSRPFLAVVVREPSDAAAVRGLRARCPGIAVVQRRRATAGDPPTTAQREREVEEAITLEALLSNGPETEVVGTGTDDAAATRRYTELLDILSEDADLGRIAAVVEQDASVGLRVLQLFNWAFFGLNRRFLSIPQAIELVGVEPLRSVVVMARTFAAYESGGGRGYSIEHALSYASRLARLARRFAAPHGLGSDAFSAALLLDLGKLVIATNRPQESDRVLRNTFEFGTPAHLVERELLGTSHAEVGARLLSLFGMPCSVTECVALHHDPGRSVLARKLTAIVHAADALLSIAACGDPESILDRDAIEAAGLGAELAAWRTAASESDEHAAG